MSKKTHTACCISLSSCLYKKTTKKNKVKLRFLLSSQESRAQLGPLVQYVSVKGKAQANNIKDVSMDGWLYLDVEEPCHMEPIEKAVRACALSNGKEEEMPT